MNITYLRTLVCCLALVFVAYPAGAKPAKDMGTGEKEAKKVTVESVTLAQGDQTSIILNSKEKLEQFMQSGEIPQYQLEKAECLVVMPNLKKAAFLVGAKHADGTAVCKTASGEWSNLAFVDMRGVSFGTQAGYEEGSLLLLFSNPEVATKLRNGRVTFGADAGYSFGDKAKHMKANTDLNDVIVYSDKSGFYGGAVLEGSYITADDEELKSFYKDESATVMATLSTQPSEKPVTEIEQFLVLLPQNASPTAG